MTSPPTAIPTVDEMLQFRKPTRVVIFVRNTSSTSQPASSSPKVAIEDVWSTLHIEPSEDQQIFLVHERWPFLNIFVVDLYHDAYQSATAHLPSQLPVVVVDYSRRGTKVSMAGSVRRNEVNVGVAKHHNLNGWGREPPFFADHILSTPPSYENPRDTALLRTFYDPKFNEKTVGR